jgi:hypothetical protein
MLARRGLMRCLRRFSPDRLGIRADPGYRPPSRSLSEVHIARLTVAHTEQLTHLTAYTRGHFQNARQRHYERQRRFI